MVPSSQFLAIQMLSSWSGSPIEAPSDIVDHFIHLCSGIRFQEAIIDIPACNLNRAVISEVKIDGGVCMTGF